MLNKSRISPLWMSLWLCCSVLIHQAAMAQEPDKVVEAAANGLAQAIMKDQSRVKKEAKVIADLIEQHMIPIVDQELFAKLSLGKTNWNKATQKQQQDFIEGFKKMLIKSYSGAFKAYNGEKMTFEAPRYNKTNTKVLVRSLIHIKGEEPIEVRYMLYKKDDKWLMYDAIVGGLDLVKTYRSQLSEQIAKDGLEKTIADLKQTEL
jgi:phospholipid transport system substrate-binding protein